MQKIFSAIRDLLEKKDKIVVAIDGKSGSGKSKLARYIASKIDCNLFCLDDFCLTDAQRENKDRGFANVDVSRFRNEVIGNLQKNSPFDYDKFNCKENVYNKYIVIEQKAVNVVEGTYALCNELRDSYDLKIFLKVDEATQKARLAQHDLMPGYDKWIEWEDDYFERQNPEEVADMTCLITNLLPDNGF